MKSSMRWFLFASLPLASVPAIAQDLLAPPPSRSVVVPSTAGLSATIDEWNALRQNETLPFSSYAGFLLAHPGWPAEAALRKSAERALRPDTASAMQVIAFFTRFTPQAPAGYLRWAEALSATGSNENARNAARRAWTSGALSADDEARLLTRFADAIGRDDHDARMERLLWQRNTVSAARQLALTSPVRQPVFDTRLALLTRAPDATTKLAFSADRARGDTGLFTDRIAWLRMTGQEQTARLLLASPHQLTYPPLDPAKWMEMLYAVAKGAAASGQYTQAYDIARQVDDAYAPGTVIRDRPIAERDVYTNLTWLAGQTALKDLRRPADAIGMFDRYSKAAKSPQTISKGLYWAGRAAEATGRPRDIAEDYYEKCATYFDQFYGQLAIERLGRTLSIPPATRTLEISANQRDAFNRREIVRAAEYLGQVGDWQTQSLFVRTIAAAAESDADHMLAIDLSRRLVRPDLAVMVGRSAGINGLRDYVRAGFPTVPIAEENHDSWTIVHAIARQESQFDRKIVSRAWARGLMQLMPATARDVAGKLGMPFSPSSLEDPAYNITLGSWYFGRLMDRYQGSYPLAVAAYNAGAGNVNKWLAANGDPRLSGDILGWIEAIPFSETRGYVQRVLENAVVYDLLNPKGQPHVNALSTYLGKRTPG